MIHVFAHRGFSGSYPEMTRAAFTAAIDLARTHGVRLGLECDVHFTADGQLGCLHDATVERTGRGADGQVLTTPMSELTVAELKQLDFGSWRNPDSTDPQQREFLTLNELLDLMAEARAAGTAIDLAIETKHPVPRDAEVEDAVAELLIERGWTSEDSGVRIISFDPDAILRAHARLPELPLTFLLSRADVWRAVDSGQLDLPAGAAIGTSIGLVRMRPTSPLGPGLVERVHQAGRECHVWTVNTTRDISAMLKRGVDAITSDHPDRVLAAL